MNTTPRLCARAVAAIALSMAAGATLAQATQADPAGNRSGAATPIELPPGATSARGNKAAVPASGASAAVNPETGSTAGKPPGAGSTRGDKAQTPKGKGMPAAGASMPSS